MAAAQPHEHASDGGGSVAVSIDAAEPVCSEADPIPSITSSSARPLDHVFPEMAYSTTVTACCGNACAVDVVLLLGLPRVRGSWFVMLTPIPYQRRPVPIRSRPIVLDSLVTAPSIAGEWLCCLQGAKPLAMQLAMGRGP
jgi:hypothetical protein